MSKYAKIPQGDYDKCVGQARMAVRQTLSMFNIYDLKDFIVGAEDELVEIMEQFGERVRGNEVPILPKTQRIPRRVNGELR